LHHQLAWGAIVSSASTCITLVNHMQHATNSAAV
jgi:hypothetical protein